MKPVCCTFRSLAIASPEVEGSKWILAAWNSPVNNGAPDIRHFPEDPWRKVSDFEPGLPHLRHLLAGGSTKPLVCGSANGRRLASFGNVQAREARQNSTNQRRTNSPVEHMIAAVLDVIEMQGPVNGEFVIVLAALKTR